MFWKAEYGLGYQGPVVSHVLDLLAPEPSTIIKGETGVEGCSIGSLKGKILSKQQQQQQQKKTQKTKKQKNQKTKQKKKKKKKTKNKKNKKKKNTQLSYYLFIYPYHPQGPTLDSHIGLVHHKEHQTESSAIS